MILKLIYKATHICIWPLRGGYDEFIKFIISRIAQVSVGYDRGDDIVNYKNKKGNTILHLAAKNGHVKCVEQLLSCHDKNKEIRLAYTYCLKPFLIATFFLLAACPTFYFCFIVPEKDFFLEQIKGNYFQIFIPVIFIILVFYLFILRNRKSKDPLIEGINSNGETALHLAMKSLQEENNQDRYYQCTKLLIEKTPYFKINAQDQEGKAALHLAAEKGLIESIKLLLKRKANTKIMTNYKKTALHLAIENSHYDCAICLVQNMFESGIKKRLRSKLRLFFYTIRNKYDYYIEPYITGLKEKAQKKIQVKKSWEEEVLFLAIEHQSKGGSNNTKWLFKRELIGQFLKMVDESKIDEVHNYVKGYAERKDVGDGDYVLRKLSNFFRKNEKYKDKNLAKLKKQESWYKDYALYASNTSLTILAVLFILGQSFDLGKNNYFISIDNKITILAKIIAIFSFFFTVRLYFKHKELDNLRGYQDKIEEINNLLISIIKEKRGTDSSKEMQDGSFHEFNYNSKSSSQSMLDSDAEEAYVQQKQRKSSFSKFELSAFEPKKVDNDGQSELIPLLSLSSPIKTSKLLPHELDKLKQTYQSVVEQSPTLDIESTNELRCKKTLDKTLIKNPLFFKLTASTRL